MKMIQKRHRLTFPMKNLRTALYQRGGSAAAIKNPITKTRKRAISLSCFRAFVFSFFRDASLFLRRRHEQPIDLGIRHFLPAVPLVDDKGGSAGADPDDVIAELE